MRSMIAFAFALMLSAPLHADRSMSAQPTVQQAIQAERTRQADAAYQYCLQTSPEDGEIDLCFHRLFYSPMFVLFCRHVVFLNAQPVPTPGELIECAKDASVFSYEALMKARGHQYQAPAGNGG